MNTWRYENVLIAGSLNNGWNYIKQRVSSVISDFKNNLGCFIPIQSVVLI